MRVSGRRASLAAPSGRAGGCWAHTECHVLPPPKIAQGRLSAAARINTRWWELQQQVGKRSLRSDCQHAHPAVQGRLAGGGSQTGPALHAPWPRRVFARKPPPPLQITRPLPHPPRRACTGELPPVPGMYPAFFAWPQPGRAPPSRVTGETKVVSTAACAPCQSGRPLASTSMRRASSAGTSTFMSRSRTLEATRAPASRHTRAAAHSSGAPRAPRGAGRTVIAQWVQGAAAPASAWRHGQWLTESPQRQDPHAWARKPEFRRGGEHRDGVRAAWACLGQHQGA